MIAMVKAGVELAFETMVDSGESALLRITARTLPLIANTIARKRLYEMNVVYISRYRRITVTTCSLTLAYRC